MSNQALYKILWIDDEYEMLTATRARAKRSGIELIPFKSLNKGMEALEKNIDSFDGVLLDAKFFEDEDDVKGSEDTLNVHRAKDRLLQLKKKFEIFILTGQAEAFDDNTFNKVFANVYKKGSDHDTERLFADIKKAANKQEDTQIRHEYKDVFEAIKGIENLEKHQSELLQVLKDIETKQEFNKIRCILESLFSELSKLSIIPSDFLKEWGWINGTSLFLSRKHNQYVFHEEIISSIVSDELYRVLRNVQAGSHSEGNVAKVKEYSKESNYFYKSIVYSFLEILCYFGSYIKQRQDSEANAKKWRKKETFVDKITGEIKVDSNGLFYINDIYQIEPPTFSQKVKAKVGDEVIITEYTENIDKENKDTYRFLVTKISVK